MFSCGSDCFADVELKAETRDPPDQWLMSLLSQIGPYVPFRPAKCARVCFELKLGLLHKNCLLEHLDHAKPKPV